jgi:hypothetical protein
MINFILNIFSNPYKRELESIIDLLDYNEVLYYKDHVIIYLNKQANLERYYSWGTIHVNHIVITKLNHKKEIKEDLSPLFNKQKIRLQKLKSFL